MEILKIISHKNDSIKLLNNTAGNSNFQMIARHFRADCMDTEGRATQETKVATESLSGIHDRASTKITPRGREKWLSGADLNLHHKLFHNPLAAFILLLSFTFSAPLLAAGGRADYDTDNDGLMEIYTVEDYLSIKDSFGAAKLYDETTGCPSERCLGYELAADLDFATTSPAIRAWKPFALHQLTFEGNGYAMKNITAATINTNDGGLFSYTSESSIKNLTLENINFIPANVNYLGAIAGIASKSSLVNIQVTGVVKGWHYTGGLVGVANSIKLLNCHFSGTVNPVSIGGGLGKGGLIGSSADSLIYASSSRGNFDLNLNIPPTRGLNPNTELGGLIGSSFGKNIIMASYSRMTNPNVNIIGNLAAATLNNFIASSYALTDDSDPQANTGVAISFYYRPSAQSAGAGQFNKLTPSQLKCPQSAWDDRCSPADMFAGWEHYQDSIGQPVWNFGSNLEYPQIRADLIFDLSDTDKDGIVDVADRFINNAAAHQDADRDNRPDEWAANCDNTCQQSSGLELDTLIEYKPQKPDANPTPKAGAITMVDFIALLAGLVLFVRRSRLLA